MIEQLSQQTVAEYASDALTIQKPEGTDYSQGVRVGKTIPAKWWNWLFNAVTKRLIQSNADAQDMLEEMQNVVTDAGITLDDTDNTQLSQAIDAKAEDKIDAYVDAKRKATDELWNGDSVSSTFNFYAKHATQGKVLSLVDTKPKLYPSAFRLSADGYLNEVNGVYFAAGRTMGGTFVTHGIVFSTDLHDWFVATPLIGRENSIVIEHTYVAYGVLYFKNYWYILTCTSYKPNNQSITSYATKVIRSNNLTEWDTVFSSNVSAGRNIELMFVIDDTLYLSDCRGFLFSSTDGETFTDTGTSGINSGYSSWVVFEPTKLSANRYIVNNYLFDKSDNSMTQIVAYNPSAIRLFMLGVSFNNESGAAGFTYAGPRYSATNVYKIAADGTITLLSGYYYILRAFNDLLLYWNNEGKYEFSYDGNNFSLLAYEGTDCLWPVCKIGSTIICLSGTSKLYSIEDRLSSNLADYTIINAQLPNFVSSVVGSNVSCTMFYSEYDAALVVPGAISYDMGVTWKQSMVKTPYDLYNFAGPSQGKDRYGKRISFCGKTSGDTSVNDILAAETHPCINRVFGQTLYLQ